MKIAGERHRCGYITSLPGWGVNKVVFHPRLDCANYTITVTVYVFGLYNKQAVTLQSSVLDCVTQCSQSTAHLCETSRLWHCKALCWIVWHNVHSQQHTYV